MPLDGIPSLGGGPPGSIAGIATALGTAVGIGAGTDESLTTGTAAGRADEDPCRCRVAVERAGGVTTADRRELVVDADACPDDGDLATSPGCRATVIGALADRDVDGVRTRSAGVERTYTDESVGLLLAAGRFVERVEFHDRDLADRARREPVAAAHRAAGRAGAVARIAAETGLAAGAERVSERSGAESHGRPGTDDGSDTSAGAADRDVFRAFVGPTLSKALVSRRPPADAKREVAYDLPTNAGVRRYRTDDGPVYHLRPVAHDLAADAMATLADAYDLLANGSVGGGPRAPGRAVRRVAGGDDPVETLAAVLKRHTRELGVLEHFFADDGVSDVVVSAPVSESPVRVVVGGERMPTNVRLTPDGAASLASRFRRESGRSFSRSSPTLDASVVTETGTQVRVAGVTEPASDGVGFAFRVRDDDAWTLPRLVAVGALPPRAAATLSLAVERGAATIVAGTRGAGKTTLLGALLWELPASTRVVTIEDTPELPVEHLRDHDRDVQALHTDAGGTVSEAGTGSGRSIPPAKALRSALRLGDGALVVGEVRGEEAGALYEAMRVGAHGHAVLGTIHGDSAAAVRERVVSDLGVPASSFAATDLVVTCARDGDDRHVAAVEEVRGTDGDASFTPLFERTGGELQSTGVVDRGDSAAFERLRAGGESHEALLDAVERRAARFERLSTAGLTRPSDRNRVRGGSEQ